MSTIKIETETILPVINDLKPSGAKLLTYFILTQRPFVSFQMKYKDLSKRTGIKNPHHAMQELIERGYIVRERQSYYHLNLEGVKNAA